MIDTLFLEDSDLLENVNITESIFTPSYENLINEAITENEMMISIYETQQFLIEQDTQIFMHLRYVSEGYSIIQEGVFETIGKGIMAILRKIKELITRFIDFVTGNRKKEKAEGKPQLSPEDLEMLTKHAKKKIAEIGSKCENVKKDSEKLSQYEKDIDKDFIEAKYDFEKIDKLRDKLKKLEIELDEISFDKKYKKINNMFDSPEYILSVDNDITTSQKVNDLFNAAYEAIDILKDESRLQRMVYKSNNFTYCKVNNITSLLKILNKDGDLDYDFTEEIKNKDIKEYGSKDSEMVTRAYYIDDYKKHKQYFERYSGNTDKYLKNLNDGLKNKIDPLRKEIESLKIIHNYNKDNYNLNYDNSAKPLLNILSKIVNRLSSIYTIRIQLLTSMEKIYRKYQYNSKLLMVDGKRIKELVQEIEKIRKDLEKLGVYVF